MLRARYRRKDPFMRAHTTTAASRRVHRDQTPYSNGPGTLLAYLRPGQFRSVVSPALRKPRRYFQGVGGSGAPPFFQGVGGSGAPPFFHGVGGSGAPPFAMITEPSPCVT